MHSGNIYAYRLHDLRSYELVCQWFQQSTGSLGLWSEQYPWDGGFQNWCSYTNETVPHQSHCHEPVSTQSPSYIFPINFYSITDHWHGNSRLKTAKIITGLGESSLNKNGQWVVNLGSCMVLLAHRALPKIVHQRQRISRCIVYIEALRWTWIRRVIWLHVDSRGSLSSFDCWWVVQLHRNVVPELIPMSCVTRNARIPYDHEAHCCIQLVINLQTKTKTIVEASALWKKASIPDLL